MYPVKDSGYRRDPYPPKDDVAYSRVNKAAPGGPVYR
jgi:hypothetical protein